MEPSQGYDQRQYKLMLETLDLYCQKQISLGKLVSHLEGLLNALENAPISWRHEFLKKWDDLELVYATALDRQADRLDDEDQALISRAVDDLKQLVAPMLEKSVFVKR